LIRTPCNNSSRHQGDALGAVVNLRDGQARRLEIGRQNRATVGPPPTPIMSAPASGRLPETEKGKDGQDDDNDTDQPEYIVHAYLLFLL
jgi:hypothetical protein